MQHYNVLTSITHNVVTPYLRFVFRYEWDALYPHMPWDDTTTSLNNFKTHESPKSLKTPSGKKILKTSGNCGEWDFTILCYVLLFSDFGQKLKIAKPSQYDAIDSLRQERNKLSHPNPNTYISENDFLKRYEDILQCLETIGCKHAKTDMDDIVQQMQGNQAVGICVDTSEQCAIQGVKCCPKIKLTFNQFLITYTMTMLGLVIIGSLYGVILSIGPKPVTYSKIYPTSDIKNTHETNNISQQLNTKYKVRPTHSLDTSNVAFKTLHLNSSQTHHRTVDNNILHSSTFFTTTDANDSYDNINSSTHTMAFQITTGSADTHHGLGISHGLQSKLTKQRNSLATTYVSKNMHYNNAFQKIENATSSPIDQRKFKGKKRFHAVVGNITSGNDTSSAILKSLGVHIQSNETYSNLRENKNETKIYILIHSKEVYLPSQQEMDDIISVLIKKFRIVALAALQSTLSETKSEQLLNRTCPGIDSNLAHKIAIVSYKVPPLLEFFGHLVCDRFIEPKGIDNLVKSFNETDQSNLLTKYTFYENLSMMLTTKQMIRLLQYGITEHYILPLFHLHFLNYNPVQVSSFFKIYFLPFLYEQNLYERYTINLRLLKGLILSLVYLTFFGKLAASMAVAFRQTKNRSLYFRMTVICFCLFAFFLFHLNRLYLRISEIYMLYMIWILAAAVLGYQTWKQKESNKIIQKIAQAIINWLLFAFYTLVHFFLLDYVTLYRFHTNMNVINILLTVFLNTSGTIIIALIPIGNWLKQNIYLAFKQSAWAFLLSP